MSEKSLWRHSDERNRRALAIAMKIASDTQAVADLKAYYKSEGDYAGATFANLGPKDPWRITPTDLLAVTALSVTIPPLAVRRLTSDDHFVKDAERLLRALPVTLDIWSGEAHIHGMSEFYELVKASLAKADTNSSNAWVTASKICARMRPRLFPVRDSVVVDVLGLKGSYPDDWPVFSSLMADRALTERVDELVREASTCSGVDVGDKDLTLKHLDVLLWMHGMRQRKQKCSSPA